jgi:hypothetical protein
MSTIPTIDQATIERFVGRRNTRHGWDYFRSQAVIDAYRQGNRLRAACIGSGRTPYQVQVVLGEEGIVQARCTCPVGESGGCKHVAALLICWQQTPEAFGEFEAMDQALSHCSRRQLIEIIEALVHHRPDLRHVIEPMLADDQVPPQPAADPLREVAAVLDAADHSPQASASLLEALTKIQQTADGLVAHHEIEAACQVYLAILNGLLDHPQFLDPQQADLLDLVYECTLAITNCLAHLPDGGPVRLAVLNTLVELYRADVLLGCVVRGIDVAAVLCRRTDAAERQSLTDRILAMLPAIDSPTARRALGGLLLELGGEELDEPHRFDLCRQTGRIFDLARRLAHAGRFDEIVEESRRADDAELRKIADLLVRSRRGEIACRLVEERLSRGDASALRSWLERYHRQQAERQAALEWSEKLFRFQPSLAAYRQLRGAARQLGRWDELHGELLAFLEQSGRLGLLVRIHLEENDIDRALELVQSGSSAEQTCLAVRVAKAAERSRPVEALKVYREAAERLIARRGRENYAEACRLLRKVRALMKRTGHLRGWKSYLERLRSDHRALRTLHDELDNAGLGE